MAESNQSDDDIVEVADDLVDDDFSGARVVAPPKPPAPPPPRPGPASLRDRLARVSNKPDGTATPKPATPATTATSVKPTTSTAPTTSSVIDDSTERAWFTDDEPPPEPPKSVAKAAPPSAATPAPSISKTPPTPLASARTAPPKPAPATSPPRSVRLVEAASTLPSAKSRGTGVSSSWPPQPSSAITDDSSSWPTGGSLDSTGVTLESTAVSLDAPTNVLLERPGVSLDARFAREVEALATTFPTRSALLETYRAWIAADVHGDLDVAERHCANAASRSADSRFVAMTRRWLAARRGDAAVTKAAALVELPLSGDPVERAGLLWHVVTLEPIEQAEPTLRSILELDPQDLAAWLALAASAMRRQSWHVAAEAWDAIAARTEDAVVRASCHASAAGIRDAHLHDLDGARKELERAVEADPTSAGAQAGLQSIFLRTRDGRALARMVGIEARRVGEIDPALGYFECAGDLFCEWARDTAEAALAYAHAAKLAPTDVVPLGKLASLYEQTGRFDELVDVYELLLQRLGDPIRRGAVLLRLGTIYESRLDRADDAIRCYQQALEAVPTLAPAAHALAQIFLAQRRWSDAAAVLLGEVDRLADPSLRAARYVGIAELLETHAGASPRVIALHERALALDPGQTAALDALDRLHRASGRWDEIIALHEAQLEETAHPMRSRALRVALAALYHDRANAPERAAEQLRQALAGGTDAFYLLVAYARALADAGKWAEHVAVLEQQAAMLGDGLELVATLYRIATVIENRLADPARAIAAYERVLANQPRHALALQAVLRLHASQSRWEEAIATERRLLELIERPEEAAIILHRIALVAEDHLSRPDDAIGAYEEALRYVPSYRPARVALERLLRAAARFDRLAQLLAEQAGSAPATSAPDRARLLAQAALVREIHEHHGTGHALASNLYDEALAIEPAMPTALWGLYRIRVQATDWRGASAALGAIVQLAKHGATRGRLLVQIGRIHELRLGELDRARERFDEALAADSGPAIVLERLRLALAHTSDNRDDDTVQWLDESARATMDTKLAFALQRLRAAWIEGAGGDAGDAYASAMQHGASPAVLEGLARCATGPLLADALSFRARQLKDPATRALLHAVAGALHERPDAADVAYREALEAQADMVPAIDGRRGIAERAGDWATAAAMTARLAAVCEHPANKVELFEAAAALHVDKLSDDTTAIELLRAALAVEPGHISALSKAIELHERAGQWSLAASIVAEQLAAVSDEATRAELLARRATLLAERLGDASGAIADLDRALTLRPGNPQLLMMLAGLHESLAQWSDAARVYEQLALVGGENGRHAALLAQARIWTAEVPDYPRAQRILEEALQLDPANRTVIGRLAEVAGRAGDAKRAAELYELVATRGPAMERVAAMLAAIDLRRQLGTADRANVLASAFELAFEDPAVIPLLESHYRVHDDLVGYVQHAEAALSKLPLNAPETAPLQVSLGRIFAKELAAPDRAVPYLRAAVGAAPDNAELRIAHATALVGRDDSMAIGELRRAIDLDPTSTLAYDRLADVCARQGWAHAAALARSASALLGDDHATAQTPDIPSVFGPPLPNSLPPHEAFAILVGATHAPGVRAVVEILDPYVHDIFPDNQDELAAAAPLTDDYPIVATVRAIASALVAPNLSIYWREHTRPLLLASDPRVFVIAPEHVNDESAPRIRFDAGYAIARLAGLSILGHAAPVDQVRALFAVLYDRDTDDEWNFRKRVNSALPRRSRKELERAVAEGRIDADSVRMWEQEERRRALGVGVVACGDLRAVAISMAPDVVDAATVAERRARVKSNPMLLEAIRIATSDVGWTLVQRMYGRL